MPDDNSVFFELGFDVGLKFGGLRQDQNAALKS
jgi:hypothetical protein